MRCGRAPSAGSVQSGGAVCSGEGGEQGERGPKSETGRVCHAPWCVVSTGDACCDSEVRMAEMMGIELACGQGRLFPVCVSVYRRVYLKKGTCLVNLTVQQIKHWEV